MKGFQWIVFSVWCVSLILVVALSLAPARVVAGMGLSLNDKLMHFGGYFWLALLTAGFPASLRGKAMGVTLSLAILLEPAQFFASGRTVSPGDALANLAGAVTGFAGAGWIKAGLMEGKTE